MASLLLQAASAAVLTHRYALDTDANDSIGGANGLLKGQAFFSNNAVVLDGSNSFVALPGNLFTNETSVSFEMWFADSPVNSISAQLYNFSSATGAMNYMLVGQGAYFGAGSSFCNLPSPAAGGIEHLVWTQDGVAHDARIYVNGRLMAENTNFRNTPMLIGPTTTNCVGGSGASSPAGYFKGSIYEFRTYSGALTPLNVACDYAQGPGQLPSAPGALEAVRLVLPAATGPGALFRPAVFADFANLTNVDISTQPDLILTSDNPAAITIVSNQLLQTVALGAANIAAVWQGMSNTQPVSVVVPQNVALVNRYSFNEQTNDWIVHDSVSGANGQIFGSSSDVAFTGTGVLNMVGHKGGGFAALPPHLISALSEVSIEAWVTWTPTI
jgi:hypothetical protein